MVASTLQYVGAGPLAATVAAAVTVTPASVFPDNIEQACSAVATPPFAGPASSLPQPAMANVAIAGRVNRYSSERGWRGISSPVAVVKSQEVCQPSCLHTVDRSPIGSTNDQDFPRSL